MKIYKRKSIWQFATIVLIFINGTLKAKDIRPEYLPELESRIESAGPELLGQIEVQIAKTIQNDPNSSQAHYLYHKILLKMFSESPADTFLLKLAGDLAIQTYELNTKSELGIMAMAESLEAAGELDKSLALIQQFETTNINASWRLALIKGRILWQSGLTDESLKNFIKILAANPSAKKEISQKIINFLQLHEEPKARINALETLCMNQALNDFKIALANEYLQSSDFEKLSAVKSQILEIPNSSASADLVLANINRIIDRDLKSAKKHYYSAFEKDPRLLADYMNRLHFAQVKLIDPQFKFNRSEFIEILKKTTQKDLVLMQIYDTFSQVNRLNEFVDLLDATLDEIPGIPIVQAIKGEILSAKLQKHEVAIKYFNNAIVLESTNSRFYAGRGIVHYKLNNRMSALKDFQSAVNIDPSDSSSRYNIACIFALSNRKSEAMDHLRLAVSLDSTLIAKAKEDSDFNTIKNSADFQDIIFSKNSNTESMLTH